MSYIFTSESVSEGHPDKLCDQISDALLDQALTTDPNSRIAIETFVTTNRVVLGGEVNTTAKLTPEKVVRKVLNDIGYTSQDIGISASECQVDSYIHQQSADIAQGVNVGEGTYSEMGAGDQGIMFGYACDQTDTYMPLTCHLSHELLKSLTALRKNGTLPYLRPDSKSQVSIEFEGREPKRIDTVLISTQHSPDVTLEQITEDVTRLVIKPCLPAELMDDQTRIMINPTGRFVVGGPHGDAGLTGRKVIVDTYGGWARHGGGAFSGKDASKVDRSAAYMARYVAKNIVAAGFASEIEVQFSYAIGYPKPISIYVDTKGTGKLKDEDIISIINENFDLSPEGIISTLNLKKPVFQATAVYGHFGRNEFAWEQLDMVDAIKKSVECLALVSA